MSNLFYLALVGITCIITEYITINQYTPLIGFLFMFWSTAVITWMFDACSLFMRYKIPARETLTYFRILPNVVSNHALLIFFVMAYITSIGMNDMHHGILITLSQVLGCVLIFEFVFYIGHSAMHLDCMYETFHKQHHTTKGTIGISGAFMSPLDFFMESILPTLMAIWCSGNNVHSATIFGILAGFNVVWSHAGYRIPYMPDPEYHHTHHAKFNKNFGLGLVDELIEHVKVELGLPNMVFALY